MTLRPEVTKENLEDLLRSVLEEEAYFDRLGQLPEVESAFYAETSAARAALMRSAGAQPGVEFAKELHEGSLEVVDHRLKRFACDFLKAAYLMMASMGMNGDARDFVIIMMTASGCTGKRLIITDVQLAKLSGYSERSIQNKRKAYLDWQYSPEGWTAVRVFEGRFDHETGKNIPTEYEVPFGDAVIKGLREWRTYYQQRLNQPEAPDRNAEEEERNPALWAEMKEQRAQVAFAESTRTETFDEIVNTVIPETLDCEPGKRRKDGKERAEKAQPKKVNLDTIEVRLLHLIAQGRDEARRQGKGAYSWFQEFKRKAAHVLEVETPGFSDPDEEE